MKRLPERATNRNGQSARRALVVVFAFIVCAGADKPAAADADEIKLTDADRFFLQEVRPILTSRCRSCHGPDKVEGGLRLDSREAAVRGGDSGPALVPGKPDESLLLLAVKGTHKVLEMPPKDKLTKRDIARLERWIRDGAAWPSAPPAASGAPSAPGKRIGDAWSDARNPIVQLYGGERLDLWSLKPVVRPDVPKSKRGDWAKNDLDRFILARLETDGISPPAIADPRTLARRLHLDLTGLPPSPEKVAGFEASVQGIGSDKAVAALVDKLLDSPRFGEHFARLWLDVVRYSDSNGFDWDEFRPNAWRFRDYVVRSFNADKPFDQFIREQLAGDELFEGPPSSSAEQDCLIATGYLRLGPHDNSAPSFNEQDRSRAELMADVTETTASAFLGLTMSCCRCHDHKYDPLSQADHYRFRAFFAALQFADKLPLDLAEEQAAIREHNGRVEEQVKPLREELSKLPEADKAGRESLQEQITTIERQRRSFETGLLMTDNVDNVAATHVLFQGDHKSPRTAVDAGFLSVLDPQPATIAKSQNAATTGRRLTLANWIAAPDNPLTARVFVNRVWHSLMGRPLVATPNDFGLAGSRPDDAALLDWLASEFVRQGWSVKQLVRQITASAAYQQAPTFTAEHFALRAPRRLSAEQLRDSLLFVSGLLTTKSEGPPIWPDLPPEVLDSNPAFLDDNPEKTKGWYPSPKPVQYGRSLFLVQKRNTRIPMLESFDLPDNSTPCARREVSTVAPQALTLLNSELAVEAARAFADRVERDVGHEPASQVMGAFQLALQRPPEGSESAACEQLLSEHSLPELCRALLNLNEFAYVD
ncbi:MAG: PSD1 and planctomycete cytochrome C domain-containing protein [Planctomycetes bacterium]|nr:PSD1 and planctomycete cytochrome C domain-containing protein [Planctomycetota bacterium]